MLIISTYLCSFSTRQNAVSAWVLKLSRQFYRLCSPTRRIFGSFTYYDSYLVTDQTQRVKKIHMYLPDHTQRVYDHITFRSHREFIKINLPTHTQRVINKITSRSQAESYKQNISDHTQRALAGIRPKRMDTLGISQWHWGSGAFIYTGFEINDTTLKLEWFNKKHAPAGSRIMEPRTKSTHTSSTHAVSFWADSVMENNFCLRPTTTRP